MYAMLLRMCTTSHSHTRILVVPLCEYLPMTAIVYRLHHYRLVSWRRWDVGVIDKSWGWDPASSYTVMHFITWHIAWILETLFFLSRKHYLKSSINKAQYLLPLNLMHCMNFPNTPPYLSWMTYIGQYNCNPGHFIVYSQLLFSRNLLPSAFNYLYAWNWWHDIVLVYSNPIASFINIHGSLKSRLLYTCFNPHAVYRKLDEVEPLSFCCQSYVP